MTQEDLAERLFVTRQAVSAWETGKALPDVETLERIAAALDADVTEVIYGTPQSPDLRRVKRRWALIGSSFAIIISVLFFDTVTVAPLTGLAIVLLYTLTTKYPFAIFHLVILYILFINK